MCFVYTYEYVCSHTQRSADGDKATAASGGAASGITILSEKRLFLGQKVIASVWQLHHD